MPKSMILARETSPPGTMMLSGDTSRWMMPRSCAACRPAATRCISERTASNVQRAVVLQDRRERAAVDEFHRQIGPLQHRLDREDVVAHDRFVLQVVQRRRLLAEQRERRLVLGELGQHQLDRDRVAGLDRVALVDLAHAAGADQLVDLVDAVEPRARRYAARA